MANVAEESSYLGITDGRSHFEGEQFRKICLISSYTVDDILLCSELGG